MQLSVGAMPSNGEIIRIDHPDGRVKHYKVKDYKPGENLTALNLEEIQGNRKQRRQAIAEERKQVRLAKTRERIAMEDARKHR